MPRTRLDSGTADRLLAGVVAPEDAPPGYAGVAEVLGAARPRPAAAELPGEALTVAAMRAVVLGHPVAVAPRRRNRKMLAKILTTKAAAAAVVVALGGTGAAAATGSLPGAAQSTASQVLSTLGISVPGPNAHSNGHADTRGTSAVQTASTSDTASSTPTHPNSHALFGLCTAAAASAGHPMSTVFPSAATCATVTHPGHRPTTVPVGPRTSVPPTTPGSSHRPSGVPVGPPASVPPANAGTAHKPSTPGSQGTSHKPSTPGSQGTSHRPSSVPVGPPASVPPANAGTAHKPSTPGSQGTTNRPASVPPTAASTGAAAASAGAANATSHGR